MHINRLDDLVLTVPDLDVTVKFYTEVLGMEEQTFVVAARRCNSASQDQSAPSRQRIRPQSRPAAGADRSQPQKRLEKANKQESRTRVVRTQIRLLSCRADGQSTRTRLACGPLAPWVTSNSTCWFSSRLRKPWPSISE